MQKQSHQFDDTVRIYKGTLATTNLTNASTFTSNISYVMMGSTTGKLCSTAASNSEMPTGLTSCTLYSRLEREWRVVRTNMAETFNMDVKLALCGVPGSVNVSDLRLLVDDDGNFSNGGTTCFYNGDGTGIVFSYTNPSITITGISTTHIPNNSARFITIASINSATPLPVELIDFKAFLNIENRTVELNWETASEMNSSNFSIQKSTDAENWNLVGIVQAAGFSSEQINYDTIDTSPYMGLSYYRLQMIDLNGDVHYSAIRSVLNDSFSGMNVYPNPSKGSFILASDQIHSCEIAFFDCFGRRVSYTVQVLDKDRVMITLTDLDSGIYTLQIQNESKYTYHKIQIIH